MQGHFNFPSQINQGSRVNGRPPPPFFHFTVILPNIVYKELFRKSTKKGYGLRVGAKQGSRRMRDYELRVEGPVFKRGSWVLGTGY